MAIDKNLLNRLDALVDTAYNEYVEVLKKSGDVSSLDVVIGEGGTDGDPIAPQDTKGGLVGAKPDAAVQMEKAVPPGFDKQKEAEGAEDEADEKDAGDSEDEKKEEGSSEGSEGESEGKEDSKPEEGEDSKEEGSEEGKGDEGEHQEEGSSDGHQDGDGDHDGEDVDPDFHKKFEKSFYKMMGDIGMSGDTVAKSEEPAGKVVDESEALVKSLDARLSKISSAVEERLAKMEANLLKAVETVEKFAKAPAAPRKSVSGVTPILRKSDNGADGVSDSKPGLTKSQILDKVLDMQKSGDKRVTRFTVAQIESARTSEEVQRIATSLGII
jgi:hypothetical protein